MSLIIHREDVFPVGASVAAYLLTVAGVPASGVPAGSAIETETVQAGGTVTFTDLTDNRSYVLYASAPDRYLRVSTFTAPATGGGAAAALPEGGTTGQVLAKASGTDGDAEWVTGGDAAVDASTSAKGVTKLSVGPASATAPIAVGDNDPRMDAAADLATHVADSTAVHGITDTSALATDSEVSSAISTHAADTTSVHGITDTATLATSTDVSAAVSAHEADTSAVHGVTDAAGLGYVLTWDGSSNYVPASLRTVTERPREFRGPTDPATIGSITLADYDVWRPTAAP